MDFPHGPVVKILPTNTGEMGSITSQEDSTCHRAIKPMCLSYWGLSTAPALQQEKPLQRESHTP